MKINFSLSLKLTLIVVCLSALIIFSLTYINIRGLDYINVDGQISYMEETFSKKAAALTKSFDATLGTFIPLTSTQTIQQYIENISKLNPEILKLSINLVDIQGNLIVSASTDKQTINNTADQYNYLTFNKTYFESNYTIVYIPYHSENSHKITVITPINTSGKILGTYEIQLSMNDAYAQYENQTKLLVLISVVSLFGLVLSSLYLLRRIIVKPIISFRNAAKIIGKGNLDKTIQLTSHDELGDLAKAFNQMTKDLKISQEKIQRYNETLEKLLDQKDAFIGQLGHDLKNPLTPLVGLLPMIIEKEKDPTIKEHLIILNKNVEYMQNLIYETLELAKLRSPETKFNLTPTNLKEEVSNVITNQKVILKENKITIKNLIKNDIIVLADKLRLVELFTNLISNAVKYSLKDGGKIIIDAEKQSDFIKISVQDLGIGMTPEQINRVFDEFYMVDQSGHQRDSTGLGLPICKRIIEKHGGKIWVKSPGPNKGTTFYFTLKSAK